MKYILTYKFMGEFYSGCTTVSVFSIFKAMIVFGVIYKT